MFAVFHALGTQPCLRGILNKLHKGEHNSGNFFRSKGGILSGPHDIEVLEAEGFPDVGFRKYRIRHSFIDARAEEGKIAIIRDKNTMKKVIK